MEERRDDGQGGTRLKDHTCQWLTMMARIGHLLNRLVLPLLVSQAIESATPLLPTYPLVGSQPTDLSPSCSDPPAVALTMEGHNGVLKSSGGVGCSGGGGSKGRASEGTGPAGDLREALLGGEGGAKGRSWSKDGGGGDKTLAAATSGSSSGGARSPPGSGGGAAAGGQDPPKAAVEAQWWGGIDPPQIAAEVQQVRHQRGHWGGNLIIRAVRWPGFPQVRHLRA